MPKQYKTDDLINAIVKMKVEKGASNKTILDFLMNDLGYKTTYSYELIKQARNRIQEIWDRNSQGYLEEAKAQLEEMLENAIRKGDNKLSLQIRQELNKLMGLYAAQKVEVSGLDNIIVEIVNPKKEDKNENKGD
jgi:NADP-dependent 3-hydroxy acid dehydrogenase YdfG